MKKACIVGYGAIGTVHAAALSACTAADFYGVCDIDKERAQLCSEKYHVKIFSDFDQMLKDPQITTVHICTPHYLHKEMAVKALACGKEIVLEKPAAMTEEEFDELCSIKTDQRICVMLQNRTNRCLAKLHDIITQDKSLGQMTGICGFLTWERTKEYYQSADWRGKKATEGGGLLINQAVHTLDIISWLGGNVKKVRASISTKRLFDCIEVEDTADALFEMGSGCRGVFYGTNCYSTNAPMRIEVSYPDVTFRYADNKLYKISKDHVEIIEKDIDVKIGKQYWGSGHFNVINHFYNEEEGQYPALSDAIPAMKLLFAFYKSAENDGKEICIE